MKKEEIKKMPDFKFQGWCSKAIAKQSSNQTGHGSPKEILASGGGNPGFQIPAFKVFEGIKAEKDGKQND